jgi:hypothetical protein
MAEPDSASMAQSAEWSNVNVWLSHPGDTNTCLGGTVEILDTLCGGLPRSYYCTAVQL